MNKFWSFTYYFIFFGAVAAFGPYRVLFYQELEFTGTQIGLLVGIAPLITVFSLPIVTGFADRTNRHKSMMNLSFVMMIVSVMAYPLLDSFVPLLVLAVVLTIFFSASIPLAASAIMYMLAEEKDLYGRMRLGGTIGFSIVSTIIGALVESNGLRIAFWAGGILLFFTFLASKKMEHGEKASKDPDKKKKGRPLEVLKNPHFLLFLLLGFCGGISFSTISTYLFPYMKELGAGESIMGLALTVGTIVEIPVLFFVSSFIKKFNTYAIVVFSIVMTGVRFFLLAIVNDPTLVLLVQLLNGFNHPLLTVAGAIYADEQAPQGYRATAQGIFNVAVSGVGAAIGGFAGGLLFDSVGPKQMYLMLGIFVMGVVMFVSVVRFILPAEKPRPTIASTV